MKRLMISGALSLALLAVPSTAGAITVKAARFQYERDVAPANTAVVRFVRDSRTWTSRTSSNQVNQEARAYAGALRTLQVRLLNQRWPAKAERSVRVLYNAISATEADLIELSGLTAFSVGTWVASFTRDFTVMMNDAMVVRHNLGLAITS